MKTILISALAMGLLWTSVGCASNPRVGHGITASERVYGDYGITGNNGNYTILRGSRCTKLSFIGDNNTVTVEDGAMLYRIEFWGKGNVVSVPENLLILRTTEVGSNQLIRRPAPPPQLTPLEEPPMSYTPPPAEQSRTPRMQTKPLPPEADVMENPAPGIGEEEK